MENSKVRKNKAFLRWIKCGSSEMEGVILRAVDKLVPPLEAVGFSCVDKAFDGSATPVHALSLERKSTTGSTDYVLLIFDKRRRPRFQVLFGSKDTSYPHSWRKSGALVWKQGSELVKYKWWGARWWHAKKIESLNRAVDEVAPLMSQVLHFLATGEAREHVHADEMPD